MTLKDAPLTAEMRKGNEKKKRLRRRGEKAAIISSGLFFRGEDLSRRFRDFDNATYYSTSDVAIIKLSIPRENDGRPLCSRLVFVQKSFCISMLNFAFVMSVMFR